tara:strand:+ start:1476 stop:2000 length:525 start_codon:yes stop_codon:yes gene_type:complete
MSVLKVSAIKNNSASSNNLVLNTDGSLTLGTGGDLVANTYLQDALGSAGVPSGTKQIFVQSAAPTGWTKDTTHNNKAMRVVSGSVSSGGNDAFTTTFGSGKTTASHTLTTSEMPSHSHTVPQLVNSGGTPNQYGLQFGSVVNVNTGTTGGGGSHSHNLSGFDLQYVDVIIATKD